MIVCVSTNMLDMQLYPSGWHALSGVFICKDSLNDFACLNYLIIWIEVRALSECKTLIHWDMPCSISICTMIPIASQPCKGVEVETTLEENSLHKSISNMAQYILFNYPNYPSDISYVCIARTKNCLCKQYLTF